MISVAAGIAAYGPMPARSLRMGPQRMGPQLVVNEQGAFGQMSFEVTGFLTAHRPSGRISLGSGQLLNLVSRSLRRSSLLPSPQPGLSYRRMSDTLKFKGPLLRDVGPNIWTSWAATFGSDAAVSCRTDSGMARGGSRCSRGWKSRPTSVRGVEPGRTSAANAST